MIAWLTKRASPWLVPLCWGIGASVVILLGAGALAVIAKSAPLSATATTVDNIEANIRHWVDTFHLSIQRVADDPASYFAYNVSSRYGRTTTIIRSRQLERYLLMQNSVSVGPEHLRQLTALPQPQAILLVRDLSIEMARFKIGFEYNIPLTVVVIKKTLPITTDLTEASFVQAFDEMESAQVLLLNLIPRELEAFARQGH